ncbi:Uncharacterized conserved protein YlxW, UPF0749 family [Paraoerskovia marina]|uniref:Uncharacterized conserved protein YlxW, UPF0749 family n=1 Tax=Paraoerskovia marina TaxID=545619 RepID=A0A1H1SUF6_9CELL|nr:DUF881 domain-containing protein [Paraoerskovia marina]SDS51622.1 Uncharacterized conserved protein YlxW, UPF0749 family [Paraoerskovia marina]
MTSPENDEPAPGRKDPTSAADPADAADETGRPEDGTSQPAGPAGSEAQAVPVTDAPEEAREPRGAADDGPDEEGAAEEELDTADASDVDRPGPPEPQEHHVSERTRDDRETTDTGPDAAGSDLEVDPSDTDAADDDHEHRAGHHDPVGPSWFASRRSQFLAAVLLAGLGFALVVQVGANQEDEYSTLRQSELVRLLDEATQRTNELEERSRELEATRDELAAGVESDRRSEELAQEQATTEGILSGRLPATGPGIELTIIEGSEALSASTMFNILEELRNAGAEAIELNGVRVVTSTWFTRGEDGLVMDDNLLESPYHWSAIGEPTTLEPALEIAGGAMAAVRNAGAQETIRQLDDLEITSTREPEDPEFATPVPESGS